jgi:dUTP pyrophosphatase
MRVRIKQLHPDAAIPKYAKESDAGLDLTATSIIHEDEHQIVYGTGLAMEIPEGFVGLVFPRSSIRNYQLVLCNSVGVIDAGYRGELQATFLKTDINAKTYQVGDRIAQIIIMAHPLIEFRQVDELTSTERGAGGHGSSGK